MADTYHETKRHSEEIGRDAPARVGAVIVPCSSRKTCAADPLARAVSLPYLPQTALETAWLQRVQSLDRRVTARALYGGRGASLGREASRLAMAPLFIVSAGLGLLEADQLVPSYGLTVADRGEESVSAKVSGRFDPSAWWSAVCSGPMSTSLERALAGLTGKVALLALTRPYAAMLGEELGRMPKDVVAGLRIFGWRVDEALPRTLHRYVMPYDDRLEAVLPGTRCDFAQRALVHFSREVLPLGQCGHQRHADVVKRALSSLTAPARTKRPRATDGEILAWLDAAFETATGVGRLLKRIRDDGIACEQARFTRLYRQAQDARSRARA